MNKDLEKFENRSDDWLAKERLYEETVSAWDFDEGKKIKKQHEINCEANEIKEKHEALHNAYNNYQNQTNNAQNNFVKLDSKQAAKILIPILLMCSLLIIIGIASEFGVINDAEVVLALPIIIFITVVSVLPKKRRIK